MSSRFWPPLGFGAPKNEGKTTLSRCRPPVGLWASLALATGTAAFALLDARRVRHELRVMHSERQAAEQIHEQQQRSTIAAHRTICDAIFNYWERRRARNTLNARRLSKKLSEEHAAETKSQIGQGILPMQEEHIRARNVTIDPSSSLGYGVGWEGYPEGQPIHIDQEANDRFEVSLAREEAHQRAKISEFKAVRGRTIDEISAFAEYNTQEKEKFEAAKNERDNYPYRYC